MKPEVEDPLDVSIELIVTGVTQNFSDTLANRFLNLIAVTIGATVSQLSFLTAFRGLIGNILQIPFGRMADKYSKRRIIAGSRILSAIVLIFIINTESPTLFINLVIIFNLLLSLSVSPWSSLLGDYTVDKTRGETIGRINSASGLGGIIALFIAILINITENGEATKSTFNNLIILSVLTSIISGILILRVKENPPQEKEKKFHWNEILKNNYLPRYLILNFIFGIAMSFSWPLFDFILVKKLGLEVWQIALVTLVSIISSNIFQRYGSGYIDQYGRRPLIMISRIGMSLSPAMYALTTNWYVLIISEAIVGIAMGAWFSSEPTYIIDIAPKNLRATYLASATASFGLATFLGSILGGYYSDNFIITGFSGIESGLLISALLRLISGLGYIFIKETKPRKK